MFLDFLVTDRDYKPSVPSIWPCNRSLLNILKNKHFSWITLWEILVTQRWGCLASGRRNTRQGQIYINRRLLKLKEILKGFWIKNQNVSKKLEYRNYRWLRFSWWENWLNGYCIHFKGPKQRLSFSDYTEHMPKNPTLTNTATYLSSLLQVDIQICQQAPYVFQVQLFSYFSIQLTLSIHLFLQAWLQYLSE